MPRLFERFHRVEGARGRTHEGTGIGLALVQELVKLHGGSIFVESELGRGSTFTVHIPFGTAHLPRERIGAATAVFHGHPSRSLRRRSAGLAAAEDQKIADSQARELWRPAGFPDRGRAIHARQSIAGR